MNKFSFAALALCLSTASVAEGVMDPAPSSRAAPAPSGSAVGAPQASVWAFAPLLDGFGFGLGARWSQPVLATGLLDGMNDALALELGFDAAGRFFSGANMGYTVAVPLEARWSLALSDELAVYPKVGLGWTFSYGTATALDVNGFYWDLAAGGTWKLGDALALRGEVGLRGVRFGAAFEF